MELLPTYGHIVCEQLIQKEEYVQKAGLTLRIENLPVYKIIKLGDMPDDFRFKVNDLIVVNSIDGKVCLEEKTYYIISKDNIIAKENTNGN